MSCTALSDRWPEERRKGRVILFRRRTNHSHCNWIAVFNTFLEALIKPRKPQGKAGEFDVNWILWPNKYWLKQLSYIDGQSIPLLESDSNFASEKKKIVKEFEKVFCAIGEGKRQKEIPSPFSPYLCVREINEFMNFDFSNKTKFIAWFLKAVYPNW